MAVIYFYRMILQQIIREQQIAFVTLVAVVVASNGSR